MSAEPTNAQIVAQLIFNVVALVILVVLLIVLIRLRRQGVRDSAFVELSSKQRLRPIKMEMIDPLVELLVVGILLYGDLTRNLAHVAAALVGVVPGIAFGIYRARLLYVRAEPKYKAVVLTRSGAEYIALALLVIVKIVAETVTVELGPVSMIITGLLALILAESFTRSIVTYRRYKQAVMALAE